MPALHGPNITGAPPDPDYEWRYEYYDDEPISFEGLKAHRYSIVIGFWVGLAVFVIFMFFVLTLLTKTGAPHPDSGEPCEKRPHLASCVDALNLHTNPGTAPSLHPRALRSSCSLFQCDVAEDEPGSSRAQSAREGGGWAGGRGRSGQGRAHRRPSSPGEKEEEDNVVIKEEPAVMEKESVLLAHFNIPNFVNSEHSLTLGEEDLQLGESAASHPGGAGSEWH